MSNISDIVYYVSIIIIQCIKDQYPTEKGYRITFHRFSMKDNYLKVTANEYDDQACVVAFKPTQVLLITFDSCALGPIV